MAATYRLTASTAAPSTKAVELRCPNVYTQGGGTRRCGRLLARVLPTGQAELVCPRCHGRHTFTFEPSTELAVVDSGCGAP